MHVGVLVATIGLVLSPRFTPTKTISATPRRFGRITAEADDVAVGETKKLTAAQVDEIGNLVEDDEWLGLGVELAIVARSALRESIKGGVRDFTGKDDYKVGDLSKAADDKIKAAVAEMRGKDEYELGDLSIAIDKIVKEEVCKLSGKDECARQGSIPALRELHRANSRRSRAPCALVVRRVW